MATKSINDKGIIQKKNRITGKLEWYARIVRMEGDGKKKEYTAKAESKSHARRLRDELSEKYSLRGENAITGNKLIFRQVADIYKEKKLFEAVYHGEGNVRRKVSGVRSLKSALHYLNVLRDYFGAKLLRNITHSDIEEFQIKRLQTPTKRGNRSISDVNRALTLMKTIMKYSKQKGWIQISPFELGKPLVSMADEVRRERVLSLEEEIRLLTFCKEKRSHLRPLIITALDTSMRKGELIKLTWDSVNFTNRTITIIAFNSKTARARTIGMTERVVTELSKLWEQSPKDLDSLVFGIKDNFKKSFASACKDAEIEDFHFHDLRHTAITKMISLGIAPMEIMKISGHSQINTFARYVNPTTNSIQKIADMLSAHQKQITSKVDETSEMVN
jgi:integrase